MFNPPKVNMTKSPFRLNLGSSGEEHTPLRRWKTKTKSSAIIEESSSLMWSLVQLEGRIGNPNRQSLNELSSWVDPFALNKSAETRLVIFSSSKRKQTMRRLISSRIFNDTSVRIEEPLYRLAVETGDSMYLSFLKFREYFQSQRLALINSLFRFTNQKPLSIREYESFSSFDIQIRRKITPLARNNRYSGWKRHQNDKGSLRADSGIDPEPLLVEPTLITEEEILKIVLQSVVGIPPSFEDSSDLMMATIRAETERFVKLLKEELTNVSKFR